MKENESIGTKESEGKLMTMELDSRFTKEMAKVMTIMLFVQLDLKNENTSQYVHSQ